MEDNLLHQVIEKLTSIKPSSRSAMIEEITQILFGHLVRKVDSHNTKSAIFVFSAANGQYLLKAEHGSVDNDTTKEIQWYKAAPPNTPVPPMVASFRNDIYAFLVLDYLENSKTIDELVEAGLDTTQSLFDYIEAAIASDQRLFHNGRAIVISGSEADQLYVEKYKRRSKEANAFPYLKSLLDSPKHIVNGRIMQSPEYYISRIVSNPKLYNYLTPTKLGVIHGDLHCGNILVKYHRVYLVDPNGSLHMPIEYDYGKILHSIHGGYHQIIRGHYELEATSREFVFNLKMPEPYISAVARIREQLSEQEFLRGLYAEAMHFATLLPHHANKRRETTALFLRCIYVFKELFQNMNVK